jgi:hypothetical protein
MASEAKIVRMSQRQNHTKCKGCDHHCRRKLGYCKPCIDAGNVVKTELRLAAIEADAQPTNNRRKRCSGCVNHCRKQWLLCRLCLRGGIVSKKKLRADALKAEEEYAENRRLVHSYYFEQSADECKGQYCRAHAPRGYCNSCQSTRECLWCTSAPPLGSTICGSCICSCWDCMQPNTLATKPYLTKAERKVKFSKANLYCRHHATYSRAPG